MGKLVDGDDGLPAEEVGPGAKEKQELLGRYVDISRGARSKFIGPFKAGATSFYQFRRFRRIINSDEVFGTHRSKPHHPDREVLETPPNGLTHLYTQASAMQVTQCASAPRHAGHNRRPAHEVRRRHHRRMTARASAREFAA